MCDSDGDNSKPIVSKWRKARKDHQCCACRELISADAHYHFTGGVYGRKWESFKHCARCWAIFNAILGAGAESAQYDLHCGVSWEDAFEEEPPNEVARLAFMTPREAQEELAGVRSAWDDEVGEGKP